MKRLLLLILLLTACTPLTTAAPETKTPLPVPTETSVPPTFTPEPTETPVPPTPTPEPTATSSPTESLRRGVNMGNMLEAPQEGEWGLFVREEYFDSIKEAGFDFVRLPVRWNSHAGQE